MRSLVVLTLLLVASVATVIHFLPQVRVAPANARASTVRSLALAGMAPERGGLPLAELRAVLGTRVGAPLDDEQLARDRLALEERLHDLGFLDAVVHPPVVTFGTAGDGAYVIFDIQRGARYRIEAIAVDPALELPPLPPRGDIVDRRALERLRTAASTRLASVVRLAIIPHRTSATARVAFTREQLSQQL